jgi:hypothetical protein
MDKFTASNGVEIEDLDGHIEISCTGTDTDFHSLAVSETTAVREFFQARRDEELGRWRWPENPDYVVYPHVNVAVRVIDERSAVAETLYRVGDERQPLLATGGGMDAARAYFEAHPERKPWEGAKPGEIWVLTLEGDEVAYQCTSSSAGHVYFNGADDTIELDSTMITAARRIWPEVS